MEILLYSVCMAALVYASVADIKKREVPDWLNYSLLVAALGIRLIYSLATGNFWTLLHGLFGLAIFLGISLLMFYTGQWGGGDSKMLISLGAVLGFDLSINSIFIRFFVFSLLAGAIYGGFWSITLASRSRDKFQQEWTRLRNNPNVKRLRILFLLFLIAILVVTAAMPSQFIRISLLSLGLLLALGSYLWLFVRAVENCCMLKYVKPKELTEGDWIAKEIKVEGRYVAGPKDLGIDKKTIDQLIRLRVRKVLIKEGIPFVPSFLMGFVLALLIRSIPVF